MALLEPRCSLRQSLRPSTDPANLSAAVRVHEGSGGMLEAARRALLEAFAVWGLRTTREEESEGETIG